MLWCLACAGTRVDGFVGAVPFVPGVGAVDDDETARLAGRLAKVMLLAVPLGPDMADEGRSFALSLEITEL